ncbi:MAG TPA: diguanylate cyclase [Candidatus Polarisedimenticolia bacterium]|nr:diguanylate cyclase [Candidatus Polarisedimenticolia bacterium]
MKHRFLTSLRLRLLILALLAFVPAFALFLYDAAQDHRQADREVHHDALRLTQLAAGNFDRLIEGGRQLLLALAQLPEVRDRSPGCGPLLRGLLERSPLYGSLGALGPDGRLFCSALPVEQPATWADRAAVRRVMETADFVIGDFQPGGTGDRPTIGFGYPALEDGKRIRAIVFATLDPDQLNRLVPGTPMPEGRIVSVVDRSGLVLVRYPDPGRWVGRSMPDAPLVRTMLARGEGTAEVTGFDGVIRLYAFSPLRTSAGALHISIGFDKQAAFAHSDSALARNLLALGLVALLALGASRFVAESLVLRRVKSLVSAVGRLSGGEMSARAEVSGRDEIAVLARAFNDMAARLASQIETELQAKDALARRVNDLVTQRTRELELLNRMGELLQACDTLEEAYAVTGRLVCQLFPDESGSLGVFNVSRNLIESVSAWGLHAPGAETEPFRPEACWALRRGRPYIVTGDGSGPPCTHLPTPAPSAYLCIPLAAQGETLGLLHLSRGPRPLDDASAALGETRQRLASMVAEQIALSLANLRLRETLRSQSIRDPMTGLFNRRYMEETLERELRRAERSQRPLGVVLLDIDHFKQFNDTFGHPSGDAVLRRFGEYLQAHLRRGDVACRHGGEEFVLIMPDTDGADLGRRAEELRAGAKRLTVSHQGRSLGPITVSMGVAAFPRHGPTGDQLLRTADAALYRAKNDGRDRVMIAE